jgi:enoyl-CoA hydratase
MGARTLQRLAVENDARGHTARAARGFFRQARDEGLRQALQDRDGPFGDGRARVNGPEKRDAQGRLID